MRRALLAIGVWGMVVHSSVADSFPDGATLPANPNLPDPLVAFDGKRVASPGEWWNARRPELRRLFQHYMYGYLPPSPPRVDCKVEWKDANALAGKATLKQIAIRFEPARDAALRLLVAIPNRRSGPAPVFVGLNFCGNHTLLPDSRIALPTAWVPPHCPEAKDGRAVESGRGKQVSVWAIEQSIDRGYAVASMYTGDIKPDRPQPEEGLPRYFYSAGQTQLGPHEWGAIATWAWGLSRAVDYLQADADIDARRIAVVGHSRLGKTALVAGAFDDRIALVVANQAGCGGTAPSRGKVGESVKQINDRFPHWFNGEFKKFNSQTERLPFDQHCLVALVAPRPVLFTNAVEDTWANPDGQFEVLKAADPVYRFLGVEGLTTERRPELQQLSDGRLGYYIRAGKHSMTAADWRIYLDFADKHWGRPR